MRVLSRYTIPPFKNEFTFCKFRPEGRGTTCSSYAPCSLVILDTCEPTVQGIMPPKRGKVGGSSAKTPAQPRAKCTRRATTPAAAPNASDETPTAIAAAVLTGLKDHSHLRSADVDPSLIVDYNESTPPPRSEGECGGQATPPPSSPLSTSYETASFVNAVSSSVPSSTATTDKDTAFKGADLSSNQTIIHNECDIEDPEPKAPLSTRERAQSITYAKRVSRGYVKDTILMMPRQVNSLVPMGRKRRS